MKQPGFPITPALLVCAGFPFIFVLAPDGIPTVYAACVGAPVNGTVINLVIAQCRNCAAFDTQDENISVSNCSVTKTIGKCEITGSVTLSISGQCDVLWNRSCFTPCVGDPVLALAGPATSRTISTVLDCGADQDLMDIQLLPSMGQNNTKMCNCIPVGAPFQGDPIYSGQGTCDLPGR